MARGGIYDQLGGGFHRYATDREWKVPHFEKMLYDNGSLLELYARAYALLGDPELARVARETVAFLEREMPSPEGAFWSAIDAETDGHEGAYYVWTAPSSSARSAREDAGVRWRRSTASTDAPFFEESYYVLHLPRPLDEQARASAHELSRSCSASVAPLRERLLVARASRERPATDDKMLADWNGLAIAGSRWPAGCSASRRGSSARAGGRVRADDDAGSG